MEKKIKEINKAIVEVINNKAMYLVNEDACCRLAAAIDALNDLSLSVIIEKKRVDRTLEKFIASAKDTDALLRKYNCQFASLNEAINDISNLQKRISELKNG